jgi:N-acetylmuramate 1-kinase
MDHLMEKTADADKDSLEFIHHWYLQALERGQLPAHWSTVGHWKALAGDASTRKYFRFNSSTTLILCSYPRTSYMVDSFERFIYWSQFLHQQGFAVPQVLGVDREHLYLIQQDCQDRSFLAHIYGQSKLMTSELLRAALQLLLKLQQDDHGAVLSALPFAMNRFDEKKFLFEVNFTRLHAHEGYWHRPITQEKEFSELWSLILKPLTSTQHWVLSHRDYHSRNMLIHQQQLYWIDYQDMMLGTPFYDLCSLLDDCYIAYAPALKRQLLEWFADQWAQQSPDSWKESIGSRERFFALYRLSTIQRQYKAIGSFCYAWKNKNDPRYLRFISRPMEHVRLLLNRTDAIAYDGFGGSDLVPPATVASARRDLRSMIMTSYFES